MNLGTLARLALSGGRTDRIRVTLTAVSSALAAILLLCAAAVIAVPELARGNRQYSSPLLADSGLRPGVVTTLLLVAVPVLFLAGQSIRFGAPARDRRLAAIRLAGATPGQSLLIAVAETAAAALIGAVAGTGVFLLLRATLNRRDAAGLLRLPTDVLPSAQGFVLVLVVVPLLAGLIGALLLRRVIVTPLGVVRRTRRKPPRWWPGLLILAGVFTPVVGRLAFGIAHRIGTVPLDDGIIVYLGTALVLIAIAGVVVGTGWISYSAGRLLCRYGRRPAALLAGRRLMADPWSGSRALSALLAAVVVGAGVVAFRAAMLAEFAPTGAGAGPADDSSFFLSSVRLVQVAVLTGVVIAAAGIMVGLAEGIVSRRRAYSGLVAAGVPRRVLGESLAWQTLAPLVPAVLVALTVGAGIVRTLIAGIAGEGTSSCIGGPGDCGPGSPLWTTTPDAMPPVPVPVGDLATLGGTVLVAMILVVGVGYLFLKMSTDIEELRVG